MITAPSPGLVETHGSWVVLGASTVLKIKKPVRFSFLDYSTLQARRAACEEEVRINQTLAPAIYGRVLALLPGGRLREVGLGEPVSQPVDFAVEMARYDEADTSAGRIAAGRLTTRDAQRVGRRLARFHAEAAQAETPCPVERLGDRLRADLADLRGLGVATEPWEAFVAGALDRHAAEIAQRHAAGLACDGHGDLRAEHVLLGNGIAIVDRIEFDPDLRRGDPAHDLAFLLMDLERLGVRWAADAVVGAYAAAGGSVSSAGLLALFAFQRALVRLKVATLQRDRAGAAAHADLADLLAWRARRPAAIAVCGPPASGKSTLAAGLGTRTEMPIVSTDLMRKKLLGLASAERAPASAYAPDEVRRTYDEVLRRAVAEPQGVIVDATLRRADERRRLATALPGLLFVECVAGHDELVRRASVRAARGASASDAGAAVAARLAEAFEPLDEVPAERLLRVDTSASPGDQLDRVARRLDCL